MADHAEQAHAPAAAKLAETSLDARPGERHEALEARPEVEARLVHGKMLNGRPTVVAQRKVSERLSGRGAAGPRPVQRAEPNRTGLPDRLKAGVEALSGMSLDGVKVHRNSPKPAQLGALAYAQGSDIHLAPGQEAHLPHEAWHVVQQAQGRVRPTLQLKVGPIADDDMLEGQTGLLAPKAARTRLQAVPRRLEQSAADSAGTVQLTPDLKAGTRVEVHYGRPNYPEGYPRDGKIEEVRGDYYLVVFPDNERRQFRQQVVERPANRPGLALDQVSIVLNLDPSDSAINQAVKLAQQRHKVTKSWAVPQLDGQDSKEDKGSVSPFAAIGPDDRIVILAHGTPAFGDAPPMVAGKTAQQLYTFMTQVGFSPKHGGIVDLSNCTSAWDRKSTGSFATRFLKILRENGHHNAVLGFESFTESVSATQENEVALADRETFLAHKTTERYLSTLMHLNEKDKKETIRAASRVLEDGVKQSKIEAIDFLKKEDEESKSLGQFYLEMSNLIGHYLMEVEDSYNEKAILKFQIGAKGLMAKHKIDNLGARIKKVTADPLLLK